MCRRVYKVIAFRYDPIREHQSHCDRGLQTFIVTRISSRHHQRSTKCTPRNAHNPSKANSTAEIGKGISNLVNTDG